MTKKKEREEIRVPNAFVRWLHKGKLFRFGTWVVQIVSIITITILSAQFCIEYLIPAVSAAYAQGLYITNDTDKLSLIVMWGLPMLFLCGLILVGEVALIKGVWRKLDGWFSSVRTKRCDELAERFRNEI